MSTSHCSWGKIWAITLHREAEEFCPNCGAGAMRCQGSQYNTEVSPPSQIFLFKSTPSSTSIKVKSAGRGFKTFFDLSVFRDFKWLCQGLTARRPHRTKYRTWPRQGQTICCHPNLNKNSFPREIRGYLLSIMLCWPMLVFLYGGWGAAKQVTESGAFLAFLISTLHWSGWQEIKRTQLRCLSSLI